jgi:hypothetical protein
MSLNFIACRTNATRCGRNPLCSSQLGQRPRRLAGVVRCRCSRRQRRQSLLPRAFDVAPASLITIARENFARIYPAAEFGPVRIFISRDHYVSGAARELIDNLGVTASEQGVSLLLVSSMAQRSN